MPPGGSGLTDAELRASPVPVDIASWDGLTDAELRATSVDVLQPDKTASAAITTAGVTSCELDTSGMGYAVVKIAGTWTGNLFFQATLDGVTWFSVSAYTLSGQTTGASSTAINNTLGIPILGYTKIRVNGPTSTGTANTIIVAGQAAFEPRNRLSTGMEPVAIATSKQSGADAVPNNQHLQLLYEDAGFISIPMLMPSAGYLYNGATWDRVRGDIANGLDVDVTRVGGGDVDHDVANTAKTLQIGANALPTDTPQTLVTASDRVRFWADRAGAQVVRRRKLRESYTAVCRLAETAARMDATFTHVANTNKQLVTFHHAASATREIRIQKVVVYPTLLGTAAGFWNVELRAITGTPATGNPAITPKAHRLDAAATEAVCLVLPTTGGTDATPNSPYGSFTIDHGIEATTPPTAHPQASGITGAMGLVLYDSSQEDDEVLPLILRTGTLEGVCINSRDTAAMVLRFWAIIKYTEEVV